MADIERELGWDDVIENDGPQYELLPEGEYDFVVTGFERKRYAGGAKLPACPMAELKILVTAPDNKQTIVNHRLYLHTRTEGLVCAFFTAIGERKHGEKLRMNWAHVIDGRGRCKLGIREGTGKYEGQQYNEIKQFLAPPEQTTVTGWKPGAF